MNSQTIGRLSASTVSANVLNALGFAECIVGRVKIVVDNSNIFVGGRDRDFRLDYEQVRRQLGGDELLAAHMVVTNPRTYRPNQAAFYSLHRRAGWLINFHRLINRDGLSCENEEWVDGDVRAIVRAFAAQDNVDAIVLLGGDGGYTNAVRDARRAGKNVFVVAWANTFHPVLAAAATATATIESLRPLIGRVHHH